MTELYIRSMDNSYYLRYVMPDGRVVVWTKVNVYSICTTKPVSVDGGTW